LIAATLVASACGGDYWLGGARPDGSDGGDGGDASAPATDLELNDDVVLTGDQGFELGRGDGSQCRVVGNGHSIRSDGTWTGELSIRGCTLLGLGSAFFLGAKHNPFSLIFTLAGFIMLIVLAQAVASRPDLLDGIGVRVLSWVNYVRAKPADNGLAKWRETLAQLESVNLTRRQLGVAHSMLGCAYARAKLAEGVCHAGTHIRAPQVLPPGTKHLILTPV